MEILVGTFLIALAACPNSVKSSEASSSGSSGSMNAQVQVVSQGDQIPRGLYCEDSSGNLQTLPEQAAIYELGPFLIGLVLSRTKVVPLFNKDHKVIWEHKFDPTQRLVLTREWDRKFGLPGSVQEVGAGIDRNVDLLKSFARQAEELKRERSIEIEREQAAENERRKSAENEGKLAVGNQASRGSTRQGKQRGRGGKYARKRGN